MNQLKALILRKLDWANLYENNKQLIFLKVYPHESTLHFRSHIDNRSYLVKIYKFNHDWSNIKTLSSFKKRNIGSPRETVLYIVRKVQVLTIPSNGSTPGTINFPIFELWALLSGEINITCWSHTLYILYIVPPIDLIKCTLSDFSLNAGVIFFQKSLFST